MYVCRRCYNCTYVCKGEGVVKYTSHLGLLYIHPHHAHPPCFHILGIFLFLDKTYDWQATMNHAFHQWFHALYFFYKITDYILYSLKHVPTLYISQLLSKLRHQLPNYIKLVYIINRNDIVKNAFIYISLSLSLSLNFEVHAWFGPRMNIHKAYHRPALCSVNETWNFWLDCVVCVRYFTWYDDFLMTKMVSSHFKQLVQK